MSRLPVLLVRSVLVLALAAAMCVVLPGGQASAAGCDTRDLGDRLPVLLVHGFQSSPAKWGMGERDAGSQAHPWKLHGEVPNAPGTWVAPPFDYEAEHSLWVQGAGSTAPRRLAEQIACLAQASAAAGGSGQVALVGHSLGGLQIRCALTPSCSGAADVSGQVAQVVTVGTPSLGSFLRPSGPLDVTAVAIGRTVQALCAARDALAKLPPSLRSRIPAGNPVTDGLCEWIPALGSSSAGQAFTMGSPELAALPAWPAGVPVHAVAADVRYQYQFFNRTMDDYGLGDLVVGVDSALTGASSGPEGRLGSLGGTTTVDCGALRYNRTFRVGSDVLPAEWPNCWHMSEMTDVRVAQLVGDALARWSGSQQPRVDPCLDDAGVRVMAEWLDPTLADGYWETFELQGCADGYVVARLIPYQETDAAFIVFRDDGGTYVDLQLFPVGTMCGEQGLPADVDDLISCSWPYSSRVDVDLRAYAELDAACRAGGPGSAQACAGRADFMEMTGRLTVETFIEAWAAGDVDGMRALIDPAEEDSVLLGAGEFPPVIGTQECTVGDGFAQCLLSLEGTPATGAAEATQSSDLWWSITYAGVFAG